MNKTHLLTYKLISNFATQRQMRLWYGFLAGRVTYTVLGCGLVSSKSWFNLLATQLRPLELFWPFDPVGRRQVTELLLLH